MEKHGPASGTKSSPAPDVSKLARECASKIAAAVTSIVETFVPSGNSDANVRHELRKLVDWVRSADFSAIIAPYISSPRAQGDSEVSQLARQSQARELMDGLRRRGYFDEELFDHPKFSDEDVIAIIAPYISVRPDSEDVEAALKELKADAAKYIESQIRALASTPESDGWLPIESAPKAGQAFLVHCAERCNTYTVYRRPNSEFFYYFGSGDPLDETPTHWMPLPSAPKENQGKG